MKSGLLIGVLAAAATFTGCAKDQPHGTPPPDAVFEKIKDPPISAQTHFAAGQLAESRGDFELAIRQYRDALSLDKNHAPSLYRLGCVYAQQKRFAESIDSWKRYIAATENSATGYSNLAFAEELAGDPNAAEADYQRGIAKDPKNQPCRVNYGLMLARRGRIGEATLQLQAVLSPAQVHYNLATVHELQHRKDLARIEYQKAIALDPNFADARTRMASLGQ
jgi:Tfp pilus assembly protein PilF